MYGLNKYMIDINIETLAGTTFSLKVSPLETVQSVKAKIQRHEGIPISHQHLVWQSSELDDKFCLNDYHIPNGATIRMVLALRGGPINTRRITTEDSLLRDVSDLMEIQEDSNLWNSNGNGNGNDGGSSHSINKHVTLLLFRDGDQLNLLRVIDRGDASSPISGAMR
jgi:AN1-type zinc finger and ubiquitin domain-containing protein 1